MTTESNNAETDEIGTCAQCMYSEVTPLTGEDGRPVIGKTQRLCRRFPPIPTIVPVQGRTGDGRTVNSAALQMLTPIVTDDFWCYEFERIEKPEGDAVAFSFPGADNDE